MDEKVWFTAGSTHAETRRKIDWNHFPVAEYVSVPGQGGSEVTRGNETKTERLRVPLREENGSRCIIPPHSPRSGKCELSDIRVAMSHAY